MDEIVYQLLGVFDEFVRFVGLFVDLGARAITGGHLSGAKWLFVGNVVLVLGVVWLTTRRRR